MNSVTNELLERVSTSMSVFYYTHQSTSALEERRVYALHVDIQHLSICNNMLSCGMKSFVFGSQKEKLASRGSEEGILKSIL